MIVHLDMNDLGVALIEYFATRGIQVKDTDIDWDYDDGVRVHITEIGKVKPVLEFDPEMKVDHPWSYMVPKHPRSKTLLQE